MRRALLLVSVLLAAGCGGTADTSTTTVDQEPSFEFVESASQTTPRTGLFGDTVVARVDVVVSRKTLDPERISLKGSFAPFRQVGETRITRHDAGDLTQLRFETTLRCLDYACIGERGPASPGFGGYDRARGGNGLRRFVFPPASVLYADPSRKEPRLLRTVRWPAVESASRINTQDPAQTYGFPFRWSAFPLPALSTSVSPGILAALLIAAAALLLVLPVALIVRRLRREPELVDELEPESSPLERAVELVVWSQTRSGDERRAALEALASELDDVEDAELADDARAAAWRPPFPSPEEAGRVVLSVREAHGLAG